MYCLKSGLEAEYSLYYFGYSREQQSAAMERQLAARLKSSGSSGVGDPCPPPPLPRLTPLFAGLHRVLESDVMLQTCAVTLRRALEPVASRSKYVAESHVHKVLFLLGVGLREAEVGEGRSSSLFLARAEAAEIWTLLER